MAKYAYVKAGFGTNTATDTTFSSLQAVAFGSGNLTAANCYDNINDAQLYGALTTGDDYILCSSAHLKDYGATTTLIFPDGCKAYSVDDTDGSSYLVGAHEKATGGVFDLNIQTVNFSKWLYSTGIDYSAQDDILFNKNGSQYALESCALELVGTNAADLIKVGADSTGIFTKDVDFNYGTGGQTLQISSGVKAVINGGAVDSTCTVALDLLGNGGATIDVSNFDYSAMTSGDILKIGNINDDTINADFKRCKLPASGVNKTSTGKTYARTQEVNFWACDNGSGYHYFHHTLFGGVIEESTVVKRTGGATYDSTGFSVEFQPNSDVIEFIEPLRFKIATPTIDLSGAGGAVIEIHILLQDSAGTPTSLTDMNCVLKAVYPDATTLALGKTVSSTTKDALDTAADLSTETVTFTGTSGTTKQHIIEVTIPQNASMDAAVCELWLELSVDIPATTEMFVCPLHTLG